VALLEMKKRHANAYSGHANANSTDQPVPVDSPDETACDMVISSKRGRTARRLKGGGSHEWLPHNDGSSAGEEAACKRQSGHAYANSTGQPVSVVSPD